MEPVSTILQDAENGASPNDTAGAAPWDTAKDEAQLSLIGRAERIFYRGKAPEPAAPTEKRVYPDGYTRRSPFQPYRVPKGYYRRIAWRTALYVAAAILLFILLAAMLKKGVLRF